MPRERLLRFMLHETKVREAEVKRLETVHRHMTPAEEGFWLGETHPQAIERLRYEIAVLLNATQRLEVLPS